jgi:hypothetical protein
MRFGHLKNTDLEGYKTIKDWLLAKIDAADLTAPDYTQIIFITPLTDSRYTLRNRESLAKFKKKVSSCSGLGPVATRNAQKRLAK